MPVASVDRDGKKRNGRVLQVQDSWAWSAGEVPEAEAG